MNSLIKIEKTKIVNNIMTSVCLTTYNGEKYIEEQLQSIISQLETDDEIIISDDYSTDKTIKIIQKFNDKRIKIFNNKNKKGIIGNIENALLQAKGDFIFLADQDDVWLGEKISKTKTALNKSDLVVSDCYVTDDKLKIIKESFFVHNKSHKNKWKAFFRNPYLGCCMAFNRKVLNDILPFPANIPMHDIWIGNVAAFRHKVIFLEDKLIYYRRHGGNISTASENSKSTFFQKINYRTSILFNLILLVFFSKK